MSDSEFKQVFAAFEAVIKSEALKRVAQHWCESCTAERLPDWNDLRPAAIRRELSFVWCYDYLPDADDFVGRLAGNEITLVSDRPFKGSLLSELRPSDKYPRALVRARRILQEPALYHGTGLVYQTDESSRFGERIVMPLIGRGAQPSGIFGATEFGKMADWNPSGVSAESEDWFALPAQVRQDA